MPMLKGERLYEDGEEDRTVIASMSNLIGVFRGKGQRACGHRSLEPLVEATESDSRQWQPG